MNDLDPLDAVFRLEEKLRNADTVRFYVKLSSAELVESDLEGSVELRPAGTALVYLRGELGGSPFKLESASDGRQLYGIARDRPIAMQAPAQFRDLVVADFLRLGLLDMVFRIVNGDLHQSGEDLRRQLRLAALASVEAEPTRPDLSDCLGHAFTVRDHGRDVATATLWIDRFDGHPQERSQSMRMAVPFLFTELYWEFEIQ